MELAPDRTPGERPCRPRRALGALPGVLRAPLLALFLALFLALLPALLLPLGPAGGPAAAAPAAAHPPKPSANAHFNDPLGSPAAQRRLLSQIINAVRRAPSGSVLRMAVFSFGDPETADAVVAAHRRGVHVRIVFAGDHANPAMSRIMKELGHNRDARSFAIECHASCRGSRGQMHAKYFSFRRTGRRQFVTMVGSVNVTRHNAERQWADLYTVNNDRAYYRAYLHWFKQLRADVPLDDPYVTRTVGSNRILFTPLQLSRDRPDPVVRALDTVTCQVTRGEFDPEARHPHRVVDTRVLIAAYAWNGQRGKDVARKVADMDEAGCRVKVFFGIGLGGAVRSILANHGVALRHSAVPDVTTHEKLMVVHGAVGDSPRTTRAWTGSHNWSSRALRRDDVIVRIGDEEVADAYRVGFDRMWALGIPLEGASGRR